MHIAVVISDFVQYWLSNPNLVTMAISPENLSSIFEIPDPENPTVEAKIFSISPIEVKLCPFKPILYNNLVALSNPKFGYHGNLP